ncbi:hypothetical protein BDV27DRAFT_151873 [Aspergillus caelatus]|uniref:Uncharacterized protein n=1 Tax=Aspergillus caelatus TaxID=61420 RepID=A0A5N7ALC1_9EURO|nr:uncharacterized protein BDV27DRAFT_151873 [Aspergillus caelatus]KAE8370615.1 hypothetical protein BDV27DRAFT_151873 [Aspergillus caelatus]
MLPNKSQDSRTVRETDLGPSHRDGLTIVERHKLHPEKAFILRLNPTSPLTNEDFLLKQDLISYLSKVQDLSIRGGYDKSFLQRVSQHMHEVHSLNLRRKMGGFFLRDIVEQIDIPSLQNLTLCGVYRQSTSTAVSILLEPKKYRTATFTSLVLRDYEETAEATQQLINWPESFVYFRFDSSYNNPFYMDFAMFGEWLTIHKDALKSINIGYLPFGGNEYLLYASGFPESEVLTLSRWQLGGWPRYATEKLTFSTLHADILLGPNLHTFILDFSIYGQHSEAWTDFGEQEEHWVAQFAKAAIERKAALRKIDIIFKPSYKESTEEQGYPWDRMDRIRDEIQLHGLVLEYSKPYLTKEKWLQPLRENPYAYQTPADG